MRRFWPILVVCALAAGCIEDNTSEDGDMGADPQPEAEPEAPQPEPQPEGQPEPQPEAQPEPQPEAQPEPQPEGEPESPEPESPEPESPEPESPEPESPEPESPEPESPEPESPEPEPPMNACERACVRVEECLVEQCNAPDGAGLYESCVDACEEAPALAAVVEGADSCESLVETLSGLAPEIAELCDAPPPPGPGCREVCTRVVAECAMVDNPEAEIAACTVACEAENPTPEQIECGLTAECQDIEQCANVEPGPDAEAQCRAACERLLECEPLPPGVDPDALIAECIPACLAETTPAERQCVIAAECAEVQNCQGVMPPGGDAEDECREACERAAECGNFPVEAIPECVPACIEQSTPEERACILETPECADIEACIDGAPPRPMPDDVGAQCVQACDFLIGCSLPPGTPDAERDLAIAECRDGCAAESTPEERACILGLDACDGIDACFGP